MFELLPDLINDITSMWIKRFSSLTLLITARILPVVVFTPILGGRAIPARIRFAGAILFGVAVTALAPLHAPPSPFLLFLIKEVFIGAVLALIVVVIFRAFESAGAMIDIARGATSAQLFSSHMSERQSPMGALLFHLSVTLFVSLGGHEFLLSAFADTIELAPPWEKLSTRFMEAASAHAIVLWSGQLFLTAMKLAGPALLAIVLLDFVLGLINRVAPQIQVFFLGMSVKGVLGLGALLLIIGLLPGMVIDSATGGFAAITKLFQR